MNFYKFSEILEESKSKRIPNRDPVRNAVAGIDSYWPKPGIALSKIQEILYEYGYLLETASFVVHDRTPSYTQRFQVEKKTSPNSTEPTDSYLVFSWHWMPSGEQVEVTAYLS
jgi:hypothetical protein